MPVEILGMNGSAFAGAEFIVTENEMRQKNYGRIKTNAFEKIKIIVQDKAALFEKNKR